MNYINMTEKSHELLLPYMTKDSIAVDMTLGNGHDTLFFSKHVKEVFSFDIQQQAIDVSLQLLNLHNVKNVNLIKDSHHNILNYTKSFDVGIFNLGYLPGGDKAITTHFKTTFKAIDILLSNSIKALVIVLYPGHEAGLIEHDFMNEYLSGLNKDYEYNIIKNNHLSNRAPYIVFFTKK